MSNEITINKDLILKRIENLKRFYSNLLSFKQEKEKFLIVHIAEEIQFLESLLESENINEEKKEDISFKEVWGILK